MIWQAISALALAQGPVEASLVAYAIDACSAVRVDVNWLGVDTTSIGEGEPSWSGDPCRSQADLTLTLVNNGLPTARLRVRPSLSVYVDRPVAAADVMRGESVSVESGVVELGKVSGRPVGEGTWRARVDLEAGEPVTHLVVDSMPDLAAGSSVAVVARRGSLAVSSPGRVLDDARIGDPVRVRVDATRVVSRGVLVGPATVELR